MGAMEILGGGAAAVGTTRQQRLAPPVEPAVSHDSTQSHRGSDRDAQTHHNGGEMEAWGRRGESAAAQRQRGQHGGIAAAEQRQQLLVPPGEPRCRLGLNREPVVVVETDAVVAGACCPRPGRPMGMMDAVVQLAVSCPTPY